VAGTDVTFRGASALSPSKELLAVVNFNNGVDWYDVTTGEYSTTSEFDLGDCYTVSVQFTGKQSVIVGRSMGGLVLTDIWNINNPEYFDLMSKTANSSKSHNTV
jgi:hypothetical protein